MNAKTMAAILEHIDKKTTTVGLLKEKIRVYESMFERWREILGSKNGSCPVLEEVIRHMVSEQTRLKITEREHTALISSLDEVPLEQYNGESYPAYALRAGDAMRVLKDDKSTLQQDLHEARLEHSNAQSIISGLQQHVSNRDARIAQLEKRESELNVLHDTIEALPGFPMQPEETYAEYLQRLAADRAHHADERSRLFTELEHLKASSARRDKLQGTQDEIRDWILQVEQARKERDKAREEATTATAEREHFRAKWDASLKARDSAQDEARRARETNEALQGQLTLRSQVIARLMMDPATDKLFNERDWSDAARKVLIDARGMAIDDGKVQA